MAHPGPTFRRSSWLPLALALVLVLVGAAQAAQSQAAALTGIETFYGKFQSASLIRAYRLSPSSTLTFMEAHFEKGAGFMKFLTFRSGKKDSVTQFQFHTQPEQILPGELLYPDP